MPTLRLVFPPEPPPRGADTGPLADEPVAALKREALGRKNWLFVGSDDGALANTVFVSLIASCQMHAIEPWTYLRDLFHLLPDWPRNRVLELAPAYWKQTLQQGEAQRRLDENPLRRALLAFVR